MKRINIKTSLLFWDIITFIVVFLSTYLMFEVVIKNIISNSSNADFYDTLDSIEVEFMDSIEYLESKEDLKYNNHIEEILDYTLQLGANKVKYDDSIFIIASKEGKIKSISKKNAGLDISLSNNEINNLMIKASHIPEELTLEEYDNLKVKAKTEEEKKYISTYFELNSNDEYIRVGIPNIEIRNINYFMNNDTQSYISNKTINYEFKFNNQNYIGIAEYSKKSIKTQDGEEYFPIFIVADTNNDFFYLINKVRNTFLFILFFVFILVMIIKIITTSKITSEIESISEVISVEGENIRVNGMVGGSIDMVNTDFIETSDLFQSYSNLHNRLKILGEIVSGISDRELLTAVLKDTKSVLDPHDEHMSVMFLDIKGFTSLTEKYQKQVFTIVNSIWMEVEKIIEENYGKINKYIGDACLIIFREEGEKKHNSSFYALKSSIMILERVRELREEMDVDFNFRVGIDYGQVVYGKTGTDNNYELGVIGDTVNTAARLEAINKQYQTNLLITETVRERTLEDLKKLNIHLLYYKVDKVRPKGKKIPKELYTIMANNGHESRFMGQDDYLANKNLDYIQKIMESFTDGITLWQSYHKAKTAKESREQKVIAYNKWVDTLILIKEAYVREFIPTMEKYISRLVTVNEFEEYKNNKKAWLKKDFHEIQEPSEDWIKYGYIEIEK